MKKKNPNLMKIVDLKVYGNLKSPGASLLIPKAKAKALRLGCWNVQTLYQIGRTGNVTREFRNYNLDILGMPKIRWTSFREMRTATATARSTGVS